jgi:hypothetical protein
VGKGYNHHVKDTLVPSQIFEGFYSIIKTLDKGYAVTGTTALLPKTQAWVVKTDSMGCATVNCPSLNFTKYAFAYTESTVSVVTGTIASDDTGLSEILSNEMIMTISPNPADSKTTVIVKAGNSSSLRLTLSDIAGNDVSSISLNNEEKAEVITSNYKPGLYFLSLCKGPLKLVTQKLIILR